MCLLHTVSLVLMLLIINCFQCLALCTSAITLMLSQDRQNADLDRSVLGENFSCLSDFFQKEKKSLVIDFCFDTETKKDSEGCLFCSCEM